jgi:hypothetical protein
MRKKNSRTNKEVLRLCRDISKRADDLAKFQPLVFRLNRMLSRGKYETRAVKVIARPYEENPFDKIVVDRDPRRHAATV